MGEYIVSYAWPQAIALTIGDTLLMKPMGKLQSSTISIHLTLIIGTTESIRNCRDKANIFVIMKRPGSSLMWIYLDLNIYRYLSNVKKLRVWNSNETSNRKE